MEKEEWLWFRDYYLVHLIKTLILLENIHPPLLIPMLKWCWSINLNLGMSLKLRYINHSDVKKCKLNECQKKKELLRIRKFRIRWEYFNYSKRHSILKQLNEIVSKYVNILTKLERQIDESATVIKYLNASLSIIDRSKGKMIIKFDIYKFCKQL